MQTISGQVVAGRYRIRERIGMGGMADIYAADDQHMERVVALKILRAELARDPDFVARFKREAQAAGVLQHPSIVKAFDWGTSEDTYYIAMEYVAGATLKELIRERAPVREDMAFRLSAEIAAALAYAHEHGVIHRDVKPQNVLMDGDGHARLTDFGIARLLGSQQPQTTGFVLGTYQYLSPEQAQGSPVDHRTDVYSLGVVLFELLTGRLPFEGDTPMSVAIKQANEAAPSPRVYHPVVSDAAEAIVQRALARAPEDRYPDAASLHDALQEARERDRLAAPGDAPTRVVPIAAVAATAAPPGPAPAPGPHAGARLVPTPARSARRAGAPVADRMALRRLPWLVAVLVALAFGLVAIVAGTRSRGPALSAVPDLLGMPSDQAEQIVVAQGLQLAVHGTAYSQLAPAGVVIGQAPGAGERIAPGEIVGVAISLGEERVAVPDLSGKPGAEVRQLLEEAGLILGPTRSAPSERVAAGRVVDQDPAAGEQVARDTGVAVSLSIGPPQPQAAPRPPNAAAPAPQQFVPIPPQPAQLQPAPPAVNRSPAQQPPTQRAQPGRGNDRGNRGRD